MVSATISEDFSFPMMNKPLPHLAVTPSLWRVPAVVHPAFRDSDDDDDDDADDGGGGGGGGDGEDELDFANKSSLAYSPSDRDGQVMISLDQEEKMDLLWEDFNEELEIQRVNCDPMGNNYKYKSQNSDDLNPESSRSGGHAKQQTYYTVKKKGTSPFRFRIFSCVNSKFKIPIRNRMISDTGADQPKSRPIVVFKVLKSIFWLRRSSSDQMN